MPKTESWTMTSLIIQQIDTHQLLKKLMPGIKGPWKNSLYR